MFAVKTVKDRKVLLQNQDGPCFVLALVNSVEELPLDLGDSVSLEKVYAIIIERCIEQAGCVEIDTERLLDLLPGLNAGLLVNPTLDDVHIDMFSDIEEDNVVILKLLQIFGVKLYHGFIMDSELLTSMKENEISCDFNHCQDYVASHIDDPSEICNRLSTFLVSNQLTERGMKKLQDAVEDNEIFILFRNNHFSSCIKVDGTIYCLVTDLGYLDQQDITWMSLSINDDGDFFNSNFEPSTIVQKENPIPLVDDNDVRLAQQLQLEEDETYSRNLQVQEDQKAQQWSQKTNQRTQNSVEKSEKSGLKSRNSKDSHHVNKKGKKTNPIDKSNSSCTVM